VGLVGFEAENLAAQGMECARLHQVINIGTRFEGGVELNEGVGPQGTGLQLLINVCLDFLILDVDEAADIAAIVVNEPVA
jgi:hypothetical protein